MVESRHGCEPAVADSFYDLVYVPCYDRCVEKSGAGPFNLNNRPAPFSLSIS